MPVALYSHLDPLFKQTTDKNVADYVMSFNEPGEKSIKNIESDVKILNCSDISFPVTINNAEYENSYVCSPFTALVPYAFQEMSKINNRFINFLAKAFIPVFSWYLKRNNINRIVIVNNWMLSTNLYTEKWNGESLASATFLFEKKFPEHTLMFRSLNEHSNKNLIHNFRQQSYLMIPSRQVYIYDIKLKAFNKTRNYINDCKLLKHTPLKPVPQENIKETDIKRIVDLYNMLYIDKYSVHNPQFTESFVKTCLKNPQFYAEGFRNSEGVLDAIGIRFTVDGITTLPIVGYDTQQDISLGLYRLVLISTLKYAYDKQMIFNASSGASDFKRLRGGLPYIEYSAVHIKHLSSPTQKMWRRLAFTLERFVVPMIKKYKL